ncbi:MAG: adenylate/guanylate cyclase domain-containing protein [Stellaceae bacterium]
MPTEVQRRLAAIVAADVAGYTRLTGADEEGTIARLRALRHELIDPAIAAHRGRVVKRTGDGLIIEFASVVDALRCAVEVQQAMQPRNAGLGPEQRIEFRVGLHVGDVVVEGDDLLGDAVNIAARLEGIAAVGGISISEDAARQVRDKLPVGLVDLGEQSLKNVARPVRIYRVEMAAAPLPAVAPEAAPALPDKPSIVVLPFANISGDPEQEFFADGITEDLLTELSRFRELFVISRNSAFVYKGKAVNVQAVAKELGVQFVVEGSVRKAGSRVRITVQLIDAEDRHIWAERYDRELTDIFAIQDEVTVAIAAILPGRVEAAERERVKRKTPDNLAAWECVLAGKLYHHRSNRADNEAALALLDRAIALDPDYAHAHAWKACVLGQAMIYGWRSDAAQTLAMVAGEVRTALLLDDTDSDVHRILAAINLSAYRDHTKALYHQERALALNPNDDLIVVQQGELLTWLGRPEEGVAWIEKAMRLNPYHPERFWSHLGRAHFVAHDYDAAIAAFRRLDHPEAMHFAFLAASYAQTGDGASAALEAERVLGAAPDFSVEKHMATQHYKEAADREHHRAALLKAGLPE